MIGAQKPPLNELFHARIGFNLEEEYGSFLDSILKYVDDNPDEFLEHHGVKGMKWGVRKARDSAKEIKGLGPSQIVVKTKSGETLTLSKNRPNSIVRFIARHNTKYREDADNFASLSITDAKGKTVGDAQLSKINKDEINLIWLGIDKSERGKGYATAAMNAAVEFGKQAGVKKLTLEVPANSPDARHIYEKLGFKTVKDNIDPTDTVWGGLSNMEYSFDGVKHATIVNQYKPALDEDLLIHFGVKGMKWGVRKDDTRSTESKDLRRQSVRNTNAWSGQVHAKRMSKVVISEDEYRRMPTTKEVIKEGETLRRITRNPNPALSGRTFVSTTQKDAAVYRAIIPGGHGKKSYGKVYELETKTVKKLTGPSEKERIDTFVEVLDRPLVRVSPNAPPITGKEYLARFYGPQIRQIDSFNLGLREYRRFVTVNDTDEPINSALFTRYAQKGYDFISDDNNRALLTQKPVILMDAEGKTTIGNLRRLTADEINKAQRELSMSSA